MQRILIMAALAALPVPAVAAMAGDTAGVPAHFRVARGQTIQQAIQEARFRTRIDVLRAGHPAQAASGTTVTQPEITGGKVISTKLTVGRADSIPAVKFGYKTGPSGLVGVTLVFTSPNGNESLTINYSPQTLVTHDTLIVEQPGSVPFYSQPGKWPLTQAFLGDYAGNFTAYTQAQLAALFPNPYITVINPGPVDIMPPVVASGQILTPTVSLSSPLPVFQATLTGTDDVSGLYAPYVGVEAPGGSYSQVDNALMPFPILSGTGTASSTVFAGQPTGTWTITFYAFCDLAGNCFNDSSATDIQNLFGATTFQVTN